MARSYSTVSCSSRIDCWGYRVWTINGRSIREHRLVMELALGRRLKPHEIVHHKDHDKLNNDLDNLKLTNRRDHVLEHSTFINDTHKECSICHAVKLLTEFYKRKKPPTGSSPYLPACIACTGDNYWSKVRPKRIFKGHAKKLTAETVRAIKIRYAQGGVGQAELGAQFGISQSCVWSITTGRTWKHVTP